jgi:hypothetical protein
MMQSRSDHAKSWNDWIEALLDQHHRRRGWSRVVVVVVVVAVIVVAVVAAVTAAVAVVGVAVVVVVAVAADGIAVVATRVANREGRGRVGGSRTDGALHVVASLIPIRACHAHYLCVYIGI